MTEDEIVTALWDIGNAIAAKLPGIQPARAAELHYLPYYPVAPAIALVRLAIGGETIEGAGQTIGDAISALKAKAEAYQPAFAVAA